jgi:Zn-dependent peptidase ImmA (M78 family)
MASLIGATIIVTFRGQEKEYVEIRANAFASHYVLPCEVITHIPVKAWNRDEIVKWANRLEVSTHVLAMALILYQRTTIG